MSTSAPQTVAPEEPGALEGLAASAGASFLDTARTMGAAALLFGQIARRLFVMPPVVDYPELRRNMHKMTVKSLPIVVVTALFTGAITVIQAAPVVKRFG